MKLKAFLVAMAAILVSPGLALAQFPSFSGIVSVDTVEAEPGAHFEVTVRLSNNSLDIAGIQLPLRFSNPHLTVDSISFAGTLKASTTNTATAIDNLNDTISIMYYPNPSFFPFTTVSASSGAIATIHFTLAAGAPPGIISIDSIYHGGAPLIWTGIGFSDDLGTLHQPAGFVPGAVKVLTPTAVDGGTGQGLPAAFALTQNYPNPFNPSTVIEFSIPRASRVELEVYNILGQRVATLVDSRLTAGSHQAEFDGSDQPSGIYFYRLTYCKGTETKKMILVK